MGTSAEGWSEELRRTGRVVFPVRRLVVVVRTFAPAAVDGMFIMMAVDRGLGTPERVLLVVKVLAFGILVGIGGWQLSTGRPEVTVDLGGVRVGRRKFLAWNAIRPIHVPQGQGMFTELRLLPRDPHAKKLTIGRDQLKDIPTFARWLEEQRLSRSLKGSTWL
jgi:hypothetical protein